MDLEDPFTTTLPADGSDPVQELPLLHGSSCTHCAFKTTSQDNITRHWRLAGHSEAGEMVEKEARYKKVQLQSWLWAQRRHARYWSVSTDDGERAAAGPAGEEATSTCPVERKITKLEAKLKAKASERLRKGDLREGMEYDSAWVKRMGWAKHFGTRDRLDIHAAAEWVRAREAQRQRRAREEGEEAAAEVAMLTRLGESFDREIERCCLRLDSVPVETLQWLASISPLEPRGLPFARTEAEDAKTKYRSVGHRYLGFCARAYRLGRKQALEKLAVVFTDEQWSLLGDILMVAHRRHDTDFANDAESESGSEEEGLGSDTEDEMEQQQSRSSGRSVLHTDELDRAVFVFVLSSIKQRIGGSMYSSPLLSFCAALGIVKRPLGYQDPYMYTQPLAGIMWWARLFMLEATFEGQSCDLQEVGIEKVLEFRRVHHDWMCVGSHSVISTVIHWMAYGKGHRLKMGGRPSIRWEEGGEALLHSGERIGVADFRRTFRSLAHDANGLLNQLMGGTWTQTSRKLAINRITDTLLRMGTGQSFATDPRNAWLDPGPGKVMRLNRQALLDGSGTRWKQKQAHRWLHRLRAFREALMVLVHVWGGQPGRGPELLTMRHSDSWQLIRNVFVLEGQVMLVTERDKSKAIRDNGRKVARFLPDRIGKMLVAYIIWLLPFEEALCEDANLPGPKEEMLEFIWRDTAGERHWQTDRLSRVMGRVTMAGTGVRIGVARYRPVAIEMGRRIRGLVMRQLETELGEDEADETLDVDPLTGETVDCQGTWNIVWDLQSTHGTRVARQHYAVNTQYPGKLQPELIASYREISKLWHQFLENDEGEGGNNKPALPLDAEVQLENDQGEQGNSSIRTSTSNNTGRTIRAEKPAASVEGEIQHGLELLLGEGARWRSEKQAESMRAVMSLKRDQAMISILPTGAGKSVLFMLPALLADTGISIVVVPFVALMDDLVDRAVGNGIDCIQFRTTGTCGREGMARAARLVVVSADLVSAPEFLGYADALVGAGLLRRVFIDECHVAVMDVSYRTKLAELAGLRRFGCPLVMLTATLPPQLERWFREQMLGKMALTVRDRTTKLNCRYR
ncbi:hypothetical protein QBC37DRAFT_462707, partial [Rhypophila decipiens]